MNETLIVCICSFGFFADGSRRVSRRRLTQVVIDEYMQAGQGRFHPGRTRQVSSRPDKTDFTQAGQDGFRTGADSARTSVYCILQS